MEQELSGARSLLREAGAERELLRSRLDESRQETEDLLQGLAQVPSRGAASLLPQRLAASFPSPDTASTLLWRLTTGELEDARALW